MNSPDNPAAFPYTAAGCVLSKGMTLRDFFAAAALISIVRSRDRTFLEKDDAEWCYNVADAMLKARD